MKKRSLYLLFLAIIMGVFALVAEPAYAAKIRVVTTLTDLADLTRNIGGDKVEVHSLATGVEDTHGVPMKPSFVPLMNRADLIILVGFDCEHAFLPALLEASRNPRIQTMPSGSSPLAGSSRPRGSAPARCSFAAAHSRQWSGITRASHTRRRPATRTPACSARPSSPAS